MTGVAPTPRRPGPATPPLAPSGRPSVPARATALDAPADPLLAPAEPPRPATSPPEARGLQRDEVALLVSDAHGHRHAGFRDLPEFLRPGDLLVVNDSATLPASLRAEAPFGAMTLNLATHVGADLWLSEPRWSADRPGPVPIAPGDTLDVAGVRALAVAPYPGQPRLWYVRLDGHAAMARAGRPIRYGYVPGEYPLRAYQTVFADVPGSAEMPSAARPFSARVLGRLHRAGVLVAAITLHTGVSSLEHDPETLHHTAMPPEPFHVPRFTARAVRHVRARGGRVIAVGTTVVRALESAFDGLEVRPGGGSSRRVLRPGQAPRVVDGLLTGLHEPRSSHLALLTSLAGEALVRDAYHAAYAGSYLWHEFGDVHLLLPGAAR